MNAALEEFSESALNNPFDLVVKLRTTARALEPESNEALGWHCLADVFYYQLSIADPRRPFSPMMVTTTGTSATPEMLTSNQLDWLSVLLPNISRPFARARIGDVLWFRTRNHHAARVATDAYLTVGEPLLEGKEWYLGTKYVTRACQLAAFIGELDQNLAARILDRAEQMLARNTLGVALDLVAALAPAKDLDRTRCLAVLQGIKSRMAQTGSIGWRRHLEEAAEVAERLKDADLGLSFRGHLAKGLEIEAENDEARSDYLRASFIWQECLEAHKKAKSKQDELDRIQRRLIDANIKNRPQLKKISVEFDLKPLVEEALSKVKGQNTISGLMILAHFLPLPDFDTERRDAIKELEAHPLQQIVATMPVDRYGRAQAQAPSYFSADKSEREAAIRREIIDQRQMYRWGPQAMGAIKPALELLIKEHSDLQEVLIALVNDSPFVPASRHQLFARGLVAGIYGDFAIAASLLVPQVENALRSLLEAMGATVTRLSNDGSQEDRAIGMLLQEPYASGVGRLFVSARA